VLTPAGPQVTELAVVRYTSKGTPDSSFGMGGGAFAPPAAGSTSSAAAVAIQTNGSIVAAGITGVGSFGGSLTATQFELARFTATGQLDPTFGTGGQVATSFGKGIANGVVALVLQPDGKIIAVGGSSNPDTARSFARFTLARYLAQ